MAAILSFGRAFLLAAVVFPLGLATHEVMHVAIYSALGSGASLLVTPWRAPVLGVTIFGLHAAHQGAVPFIERVANNILGPTAAALLLVILWTAVRGRAARAALLANVLVLLFFALLEGTYPLAERAGLNVDFLLLPELNYGGALAIVLVVIVFGLIRTRVAGER